MPDPHGNPLFRKVGCTVQDIFVGMSSELLVLFIINVLDIQKNQDPYI